MRSLWSDKDAEAMVARYGDAGIARDLALRVYTSRLLGRDPSLVLHGGGNTSVKTVAHDLIGEEAKVQLREAEGRLPDAERAYLQVMTLREKLMAGFPALPENRQRLAQAILNLAEVRAELGRLPEAEQDYQRAEALNRQLVADFPQSPQYAGGLAVTLTRRGEWLACVRRRREQLGHHCAARHSGRGEHHESPGCRRHIFGAAESRLQRQRHRAQAHERPADPAVRAGRECRCDTGLHVFREQDRHPA